MSITILRIRDQMRPALQRYTELHGKDYESDIQVDFTVDELVLRAYRVSTKRMSVRTVTREGIADNLYKTEFVPKVIELFEELK